MAWVRVVAVKMVINGQLIWYLGDRIYKTYGLDFECEGKNQGIPEILMQYSIEREGRGVDCGQKTVPFELR